MAQEAPPPTTAPGASRARSPPMRGGSTSSRTAVITSAEPTAVSASFRFTLTRARSTMVPE